MKKNRFLTFLFSLIPGCGLMYLGYMKKGSQVMLMSAATGLLGGLFLSMHIPWFAVLFFLLLPIIWFYQMFDAMHTVVRMRKHGMEMPDDDGFVISGGMLRFSPARNRTSAKIAAAILIIVGILTLVYGVLNNIRWNIWFHSEVFNIIERIIRNNLIPAAVSIALIIAGIKLLRGGKVEKADAEQEKEGDIL